jgi:hypothetical protein
MPTDSASGLSEALRLAAFDIERLKTKLGEYGQQIKGRLGKAERITAATHNLARTLHTLNASGTYYEESQAFASSPPPHKSSSASSILSPKNSPPKSSRTRLRHQVIPARTKICGKRPEISHRI